MSSLSVTNTFSTGVIDATQFNSNYSDIVTYVNNRNSGSASWDGCSVSSAVNVPLIANNSTGTQDVAQFYDNGVFVGEVFNGGIVSWPYQDYAYCSGLQFTALTGTTVKWAPTITIESQRHSNLDSTPKYTCASDGKYLVTFECRTNSSVSAFFNVLLYKNGLQVSSCAIQVLSTVDTRVNLFTDVIQLSVGDYIEIYVDNQTGASVNFGNGSKTMLTIVKIA